MTKRTKAYKALDLDFACRGFQYEVGKTYSHKGEVKVCRSGFHACTNPLDVLNYYDLTASRFAVVSMAGDQKDHSSDSKIAAASITIEAELRLPEFIKTCVDWLIDHTQQASSGDYTKQASSGDHTQQASSGYHTQQASSGDHTQQASSGDYTQHTAKGKKSRIAASGSRSIARGVEGTWICLFDSDEHGFVSGKIGENGLKPMVFYRAEGGKLVEADQ